MTRYVTRAALVLTDTWGDQQIAGADTVYETEHGPVETGLVNVQGVALYRVGDRRAIGFDLQSHVRPAKS